jgi:hypothetical protein
LERQDLLSSGLSGGLLFERSSIIV